MNNSSETLPTSEQFAVIVLPGFILAFILRDMTRLECTYNFFCRISYFVYVPFDERHFGKDRKDKISTNKRVIIIIC